MYKYKKRLLNPYTVKGLSEFFIAVVLTLTLIIIMGSVLSLFPLQEHLIPGAYKFDALITTFEMVLSDCPELREISWRCVIIDEAHRLKNRNCKLLDSLKMLDMVRDATQNHSWLQGFERQARGSGFERQAGGSGSSWLLPVG